MTNEIRSAKQDLVERLGVFMEQKEQLAPVAARILSYIVLTGKIGTTFEDLVTDLCASKSTISTHLNHLADLKKIVYFTKPGDRKKYYTINEDTIVLSIDELMQSWIEQRALHQEIKVYKNRINSQTLQENPKFDLDFHDNYIQFLEEVTQSVSTLRSKIIAKNTKL
ncbi:GbsR/MarR family transcriptional regulator [Gelidibacter salicanalis]|uniref:Transcriptional regulator n=1 Tax=Gelidibacter salicanalis TaxID=291193 RepID=A0A934KUC6_9FLAO|nr:transcriptional regulator [Gelidibacter salicanalis]MBJ7880938.1 transcriptional regulator [Gelidibacter salicanalis]